jgi:hypothetical protein
MVGKRVYWYTSEIGIKKNASNKMRDNWTKTVQYIFKYKQNGKGQLTRVTKEMK